MLQPVAVYAIPPGPERHMSLPSFTHQDDRRQIVSQGKRMYEVSTLRLYLLRATYLLMVVGLGVTNWPMIVSPPADLSHMSSVVRAMLGAVPLLALLGFRYPIKMLPLLYFELIWKAIWVMAYGLPLWSADKLDAGTGETMMACVMGLVIFPLAIPWGYTFKHYLRAPADRRIRRGG
jgi:hypothetical protein